MKFAKEKLRSPRAAAVNGIIFSILTIVMMLFSQSLISGASGHIDKEWLDRYVKIASYFLTLIPFIGISFLWFTGVLRDWLGASEDRFVSTVFIGSAILIVGLFFVWGSVFGALINTCIVVRWHIHRTTAPPKFHNSN